MYRLNSIETRAHAGWPLQSHLTLSWSELFICCCDSRLLQLGKQNSGCPNLISISKYDGPAPGIPFLAGCRCSPHVPRGCDSEFRKIVTIWSWRSLSTHSISVRICQSEKSSCIQPCPIMRWLWWRDTVSTRLFSCIKWKVRPFMAVEIITYMGMGGTRFSFFSNHIKCPCAQACDKSDLIPLNVFKLSV
jgi:hypothetical protein